MPFNLMSPNKRQAGCLQQTPACVVIPDIFSALLTCRKHWFLTFCSMFFSVEMKFANCFV